VVAGGCRRQRKEKRGRGGRTRIRLLL